MPSMRYCTFTLLSAFAQRALNMDQTLSTGESVLLYTGSNIRRTPSLSSQLLTSRDLCAEWLSVTSVISCMLKGASRFIFSKNSTTVSFLVESATL